MKLRTWHPLVAVMGVAGLGAGVRADTWPLFRHGSRNTGTSADRLDAPLRVAWQKRMFRPSEPTAIGFSYIVADEERVYVSAQRRGCPEAGPLWALDLRTGEEVWRARGCLETGALADGAIYSILAIPGREYEEPVEGPVSPWVVWLTALDAHGGQVRWQRHIGWWPGV
ncbi:MAG: hypothetical protein FJX74_00050 [Armatimonadetes bacterium]|nr:hypothetical protein [Armatimonadota bacterium]